MEIAAVVLVSIVLIVREVLNYRQINKLQELLKAKNLGEYYVNKKESPTEENILEKENPNEIDLTQAFSFKMPESFNLEIEGEEGTKRIKIYPDGTEVKE